MKGWNWPFMGVMIDQCERRHCRRTSGTGKVFTLWTSVYFKGLKTIQRKMFCFRLKGGGLVGQKKNERKIIKM